MERIVEEATAPIREDVGGLREDIKAGLQTCGTGEYEAVRRHLPPDLQAAIAIAYLRLVDAERGAST